MDRSTIARAETGRALRMQCIVLVTANLLAPRAGPARGVLQELPSAFVLLQSVFI